VRLIATAWSDNPLKGGPFLKWMEERLDWRRYDCTFVGRTCERFARIRHIPPQGSRSLARILRQHDVYVMASRHEACSNALLEALSCGLPVLYLDDGANGELTQFGGLPFRTNEEALAALERLGSHLDLFRECIRVPGMNEIAGRYLELFDAVLAS
jgi:glycosyltransferase involved in cell wall biosynthesis